MLFLLLYSNNFPEENKDNTVKCLTDGNTDAKPSHRGVKISVEMNLAVLLGIEIKPFNHSTECPNKGKFQVHREGGKIQSLPNRQA